LFEKNAHGRQLIRFLTSGARSDGLLNIKPDEFFSVRFPIPPRSAEQQKIADCLTSLDEVIVAQGRKVETLKAHKKGLMQQLFPREGETLPRLRFPEFRNGLGWDKRRLGDFIHERCEIAEGTVPLYSLTINEGVTAKTDRYERSFLVTNKEDAYKLVLPNDFAFNPMNLRFGAIGRHSGSEPVALSKYYNIFFCDESVDPRFCEIYFRSDGMVAYYDVMATGTLIEKRRVHFDRFLGFSIPFPQIEEQQRIADCLSALDARIVAEVDKLAALKTHKKGLMQQLFPSPEGD
jgi:type I restriction enzyme, S subunit